MLGLRQAELARQVGISASYLNLIEHNRRKIGGKLLLNLARVLAVEPSMLTEGAEVALLASLREAAAGLPRPIAELDKPDEFAGRFPGWAEVLAQQQQRITGLERIVQTLSDRLTHDPQLAASMHEVLSTAAAIRSTAAILAEPGELDPEWRDRFHQNLNQDSQRLADSSRLLVSFLDESDTGDERRGVPQEDVDRFFADAGYHFPALEQAKPEAQPALIAEVIADASSLLSEAARLIAREALQQYCADARAIPLEPLQDILNARGFDLDHVAHRFRCDMATVLRRVGLLPEAMLGQAVGLVVCDASGAILFRKSAPGFILPRFGASCATWPLFTALTRPQEPLRRQVVQHSRGDHGYECFAVSWPHRAIGLDRDPLYRAVMLIVPSKEVAPQAQVVGASCRVCSYNRCAARREPSLLREEF